MTTNDPPVAAASRRRSASPGRVVAIVGSVLLLIIGTLLALGGAALMVLFGSDNEISTDKHPVDTPTAAVVTDVATIRDTAEVADALGTSNANVNANGGNTSGLFVGIGPAAAVDRYLSGVAVDQAVDFDVDPYALNLSRRAGTETTATPPGDESFWVASVDGTGNLALSWPMQDGNFRLVVMNSDGTAGMTSQLSIGVGLDGMFGVALGLLIGGVVLILVAIVLLVATRPRAPTIAYGPPPGTRSPPPAAPVASTSDRTAERPDPSRPNRSSTTPT
jgi:hypothetical protein